MVFRTAPISIPARVRLQQTLQKLIPARAAVLNRRPLYQICAKKVRIPPSEISIFCVSDARSGWDRTEHFPRIYFYTKLKNLPLFFLLQLLQKMKCWQKSC